MTTSEVLTVRCLFFLLAMSLVACDGSPASSPAADRAPAPTPDSPAPARLEPLTPPDTQIAHKTDEPIDDADPDTVWSGELEARATAIEQLAERDPQTFSTHLQLLLTDADAEIRLSTVENIIDHQPPDTRYWLEQAALDPNAEVRETALEGLAELFGTLP